MIELNFSLIFEHAISEWPVSIDVEALYYAKDKPQKYSVIGLGEMKDDICEKYLNTEYELLICNMHEAIFVTVRSLAELCTLININHIRKSVVKKKFEEKIRRAIEIPELNANSEDIALVKKYLSLNKD
jgi:hypothetical protein